MLYQVSVTFIWGTVTDCGGLFIFGMSNLSCALDWGIKHVDGGGGGEVLIATTPPDHHHRHQPQVVAIIETLVVGDIEFGKFNI